MKRNLLISDIDSNIINCINGYIIENTMVCNCYPGWTSSNYDSINQCDIDTGANNTLSNTRIINEGNTEKNDKSSSIMRIGIIILVLTFIYCAILYLYKKWKNIKLIKQKIKYQKNLNKKIELELSLKLDEIDKDINEYSCNPSKKNKTISKECEHQKNNINSEQKMDSISIPVKTPQNKKSPINKDSNL